MKLTVTGQASTSGITAADTRSTAAQTRRAMLHGFANLLRDMADRMANSEATSGQFDRNGVKGKFKIED